MAGASLKAPSLKCALWFADDAPFRFLGPCGVRFTRFRTGSEKDSEGEGP